MTSKGGGTLRDHDCLWPVVAGIASVAAVAFSGLWILELLRGGWWVAFNLGSAAEWVTGLLTAGSVLAGLITYWRATNRRTELEISQFARKVAANCEPVFVSAGREGLALAVGTTQVLAYWQLALENAGDLSVTEWSAEVTSGGQIEERHDSDSWGPIQANGQRTLIPLDLPPELTSRPVVLLRFRDPLGSQWILDGPHLQRQEL